MRRTTILSYIAPSQWVVLLIFFSQLEYFYGNLSTLRFFSSQKICQIILDTLLGPDPHVTNLLIYYLRFNSKTHRINKTFIGTLGCIFYHTSVRLCTPSQFDEMAVFRHKRTRIIAPRPTASTLNQSTGLQPALLVSQMWSWRVIIKYKN